MTKVSDEERRLEREVVNLFENMEHHIRGYAIYEKVRIGKIEPETPRLMEGVLVPPRYKLKGTREEPRGQRNNQAT